MMSCVLHVHKGWKTNTSQVPSSEIKNRIHVNTVTASMRFKHFRILSASMTAVVESTVTIAKCVFTVILIMV